MIEIRDVTKRYDSRPAVEQVSFTAPSGAVTGFLGPNGAGKTTTLRILLGLTRPDAGVALIDGEPYANLTSPRRTVGAVLDSVGFHPSRSGRNHLRVAARSAGISPQRVDEVLQFVELESASYRAVGGYSHGMRQRLALASALLGDPSVLVLDEPTNGLDPAGMAWLRRLLRDWASQGRTVLISSHVLTEIETVADRVVIVNKGRIVHEGEVTELSEAKRPVVVRTPDGIRLAALAEHEGWGVRHDGDGRLEIDGASANEIGLAAARAGVALTELAEQAPTRQLEELFLKLTGAGTENQA